MISLSQVLASIALKASDMKVYLDMDGCLTDFDKAVRKLGPEAAKGLGDDAKEADQRKMWQAIDNAREFFWSEMEWMPEGKKLWEVVKPYNPVLLSSPGQIKWAQAGKELWVRDNLPGVSLIVEPDKYYYAEMDAVLIDDMKRNTNRWRDCGGTSILYENSPDLVRKELANIKKKI